MTTIFDDSAHSKDHGNVCANTLTQIFPRIPLSSMRLSPMSLSKTQDFGLDDDDEDGSHVFRSSPTSTQTPPKESPSSGSSELPSVLSDKSGSRGCSGEGSTGCFTTSEVTDNERSISEGSLSPQRATFSNGVSSSPLRQDDYVSHSVYDVPDLRSNRDSPIVDIVLPPSSVVCRHQPSIPDVEIPKPAYAFTSLKDTKAASTTPSTCDLSVSFPSSVNVCNVTQLTADNIPINSLPVTSIGRNFSLHQSDLCNDSGYDSHHCVTTTPLNLLISKNHTSRSHSVVCTELAHSTPSGRASFNTSSAAAKTPAVSRSLCSRYGNDFAHCKSLPICDNTTPYKKQHLPQSTISSSISLSFSPNFSVNNSTTNLISRNSHPYSIQKCTKYPHFDSAVVHNNKPQSVRPRQLGIINGRNKSFVTDCANIPSSEIYLKEKSCDSPYEFSSKVAASKRHSNSTTSVRFVKRRRLMNEGHITRSSSSIVPNRVRSSNTCRPRLQEPNVVLPLTLYPPSPVPVNPRQRIDAPTLHKHGSNQSLINQCQQVANYKYSRFPFTVSVPNPQDVQLNLHAFISSTTFPQNGLKYLEDNFLMNSVRCAALRFNQSHVNICPSSPIPKEPDLLLDCLPATDLDFTGRTTPPLSHDHNTLQFHNTLHSIRRPHSRHRDAFASECVIFSRYLFSSKCVVCAECCMQIFDFQHALKLTTSEDDDPLFFCSASCLSSNQTTKLQNQRLPNSVFRDAGCHRKSLSSCCNVSSDGLMPKLISRAAKFSLKRTSDRNIIRRKNLIHSSCYSAGKGGKHKYIWRFNPYRWQRFSKDTTPKCSRLSTDFTREYPTHNGSLFPTFLQNRDFNHIVAADTLHPDASTEDSRVCLLCHARGDAPEQIAGRLLHFDHNAWLHLNCILWCYDTYETVGGSLVGVSRALEKAGSTLCTHCSYAGAGLPCFHPECDAVYHLPCAYSIGCSFYDDRAMFCPAHREERSSLSQLPSLAVYRRVFISRDESSQVTKAIQHDDAASESSCKRSSVNFSIKLRVGGLLLHNIGQLLPEQLASGSFNSSHFIYPVGYRSTRFYWSYRDIRRRCQYHCYIEDGTTLPNDANRFENPVRMQAKFVVIVDECGEPLDKFEHSSCNGVWQQILAKINHARRSFGLRSLRIMSRNLRGETLYGLTEPHIVRAIESLPGVDRLSNYIFKFGRLQLIREMPLAINPTGCARSEPKLRTHVRRRAFEMGVGTQHATPVSNTSSIFNLQSPVRSSMCSPIYLPGIFSGPSKAQLYRRLRSEWRMNVLFGRSRIQGLGLYAARDISKHTFIIEYLGELIRNEVGNRRERLYESQNRGVYMFRVDDDSIVDATMCGGPARYINHSCDPNCTAEILVVDGRSHIIIIANRDIEKGEEITYDYKFDIEEDRGDRIPCLCGASSCRKWMN